MTTQTQRTQAGGNTKPQPLRAERSRKYAFTYNNYSTDTETQLISKLNSLNGKFIIAREVGAEGTPHLQGYVEFKNPINFDTLKQINEKIHWEKCKGTTQQNVDYCSKDGVVIINNTGIKCKKPLKEIVLWLQWQKDLEEIILTEPDDRTIHWFWEPNGKLGKTTMLKYLARKYGAIPLEGKKTDILHCAAEFESEIYVYDVERSLESFISYGAIEKIKNGIYMSAKYDSKPIDRNPPHVIILANFEPEMKKLSADRWHIVKIDNTPILGK